MQFVRAAPLIARTPLWPPQYRLRLNVIDGRMTSECLIWKNLEGRRHGLIEILSANLLGGNEENRETRKSAGPNFEPDISRMQAYNVTFRIDIWCRLFNMAVSSSAWVALNEIGWLVNGEKKRTWPNLRCHPTPRGTEECHEIPGDSLSPDRDLTSEL
jgi:hypothetical protein